MGARTLIGVMLTAVLAVTPTAAMGQGGATPPLGWLAKSQLAQAKAEAKKWRADAALFQIQSFLVTDGKAVWNYDFFAPGAAGQCLRVSFGKGMTAYSQQQGCGDPGVTAIQDPAIDSDKVVETARKEGLARPQLTVGLMKSGSGSTGRLMWTVMEGRGTKTGDQMVDIDAMTGKVTSKSKMP